MCCLPRYVKAAGKEPKAFSPEAPVYGSAQDLEPPPGEVLEEPGWFARINPFQRSADNQAPPTDATVAKDEERGFLGRLWPF
ncbi:MAG: hypothetical protein AB7G75_00565 [Candidatus Binatia bacterium]